MSVSFTGFKDCKIYKKDYVKEGIYKDNDGDYRRGDKKYQEVMMTARLTNDKDGDHLSQYLMSLPVGYENQNGYDQVNIRLIKSTPMINEDDAYLPNLSHSDEAENTSVLKLNGKQFDINKDEQLPTASFLAHMTKRDIDLTGMNDIQKMYATQINKAIEEKAFDYLEI